MSSLSPEQVFSQLRDEVDMQKLLRLNARLHDSEIREVTRELIERYLDYPCVINNGRIISTTQRIPTLLSAPHSSANTPRKRKLSSSSSDNEAQRESNKKQLCDFAQEIERIAEITSPEQPLIEYKVPKEYTTDLNGMRSSITHMQDTLIRCNDTVGKSITRMCNTLAKCNDKLDSYLSKISDIENRMNGRDQMY